MLGAEHPDTLKSMGNLAIFYDEQGETEKAKALYLDCLEARKKVLGAEHPDTLTSKNNLALFYEQQGDTEKAKALCLD